MEWGSLSLFFNLFKSTTEGNMEWSHVPGPDPAGGLGWSQKVGQNPPMESEHRWVQLEHHWVQLQHPCVSRCSWSRSSQQLGDPVGTFPLGPWGWGGCPVTPCPDPGVMQCSVLPGGVAGSEMKVGDESAWRCDPIKAVPGLSQSSVL